MTDSKYLETYEQLNPDLRSAVKRMPENKVSKNHPDAPKDFCLFILTFGRPNACKTLKTLQKSTRFNTDYYLVCSDDDKSLPEYIENFGERVLVFNKKDMLPYIDRGDNFDKFNVILYARNICFTLADMLGYRYFCEFDDDYTEFRHRFHDEDVDSCLSRYITDYDELFRVHLDFFQKTPTKTITISQMGDYIGGWQNGNVRRGYQRKVMNSFFCDIQQPFLFEGTINEDVNFYTQGGRKGEVMFNLFGFGLNQEMTQQNSGGMTEQYLDGGTYLKSFYSVMYSPSCVKVGTISHGKNERYHHRVDGKSAYVKIIDPKYKANTYNELNPSFDEW